MERSTEAERSRHRLDLVVALLLGLAALGSAWSAWRSAWWSSVQSIHFVEASTARTESLRASTRAQALAVADVGLFVEWIEAISVGNEPLALFLQERFREEFLPAFEAWRNLPRDAEVDGRRVPPGSPFELPEYRPLARLEADRLLAAAERAYAKGKYANEVATNYVLTLVVFATVFLLGGISTKVEALPARRLLVGLAAAFLIVGVVAAALVPSFST